MIEPFRSIENDLSYKKSYSVFSGNKEDLLKKQKEYSLKLQNHKRE